MGLFADPLPVHSRAPTPFAATWQGWWVVEALRRKTGSLPVKGASFRPEQAGRLASTRGESALGEVPQVQRPASHASRLLDSGGQLVELNAGVSNPDPVARHRCLAWRVMARAVWNTRVTLDALPRVPRQ